MEIPLRRISYAKYDDFIEQNTPFKANSTTYFETNFSDVTEEVMVDGQAVSIDIFIDEFIETYDNIFAYNSQNPAEAVDIKFAEMLYKGIGSCGGIRIPKGILFEKEVWAYLNCFVFFDVVKKRFFPNAHDLEDEGRVNRAFFCNDTTVDRTGLRWLWALADATYDKEHGFSLTATGRSFIDPVKAIYERTIGLDRTVFKAFIRAIELLGRDPRIKSSRYRSILPTHIRNLATMRIYESNDSVEDLAQIFAAEMKSFMDDEE